MDLRAFTPKWLQYVRDTKSENNAGCFPMFFPDPKTGRVTVDVTIPAGATARVNVPVRSGSGWRWVSQTVGAGTYRFRG